MKAVQKGGNKYFECEQCGFYYKNSSTAMKCEAWCKKNHSCNLELIKLAVNR